MTKERRLPPPKNGTIFRVVEYPPDSQRVAALRAPDASHDAKSEGYVRDLKNARGGVDENNQPDVQFSLNAAGADKFKRETGRNVGKQLAVILDGQVPHAVLLELFTDHGSGTLVHR